jgi:hypothetical protein
MKADNSNDLAPNALEAARKNPKRKCEVRRERGASLTMVITSKRAPLRAARSNRNRKNVPDLFPNMPGELVGQRVPARMIRVGQCAECV